MPFTQKLLLSVPTIPLAIIIVAFSVLLTAATALLTHRIVPSQGQKKNGYLLLVIFGVNSIIYSILLTLVLFTSWIGFQDAASNVEKEASCLIELYRNTETFLPDMKQKMHVLLEEYAKSIVNEEWKDLARSQLNPHTGEIAREIWKTYTRYSPKTSAEQVWLEESIHKLYELRECRAKRLEDSRTGVYSILWVLLLLGEIVTVFSISLFAEDLKSKLVVTVLFGTLVGICFFVIMLFDFPFTGELTVSPGAFTHALQNW